ncbi:MAG TPA: hypothetical protein V6C65_37840, partial [Allocoleopsis sp.]
MHRIEICVSFTQKLSRAWHIFLYSYGKTMTIDVSSSYFRSNIDAMTGYVPGEQPKPGTPIIKLNT